jgi:hypothetical protein
VSSFATEVCSERRTPHGWAFTLKRYTGCGTRVNSQALGGASIAFPTWPRWETRIWSLWALDNTETRAPNLKLLFIGFDYPAV